MSLGQKSKQEDEPMEEEEEEPTPEEVSSCVYIGLYIYLVVGPRQMRFAHKLKQFLSRFNAEKSKGRVKKGYQNEAGNPP